MPMARLGCLFKGGAGTWLRMLGKAPAKAEGTTVPPTSKPAGTTKWEYLAVEVSSVESAEGAITYQARDDDEKQPGITGVTTMADVLGAYGKLGWELAGVEKVGKGGGAFTGAWAAVFKRPLASKGAGR